jgi:hypothetical protein
MKTMNPDATPPTTHGLTLTLGKAGDTGPIGE